MAIKQKKTQKELYTELLAICQTDEQKEFVEKKILQLENKSVAKKETEKQIKNLELATAVYEYMQQGVKYTVTELMKEVPAFQEIDPLTNQYATSVVYLLIKRNMVKKVVEKGRSKFEKCFSNEVEGE